jgi:hypothetical protein
MVLYILSGLLIAMELASGAVKLAGIERMRRGARRLGVAWRGYLVIGGLEVAAAAGLAAGLAWRPIGLAAAAGVAALMVGALAYHRRARDPIGETAGAAVTLLLALAYVGFAR